MALVVLQGDRQPRYECDGCRLHERATTTNVATRGCGERILFVGEAPGRDEDQAGVAFVGDAGSELSRRLKDIGIPETWCRFTNIVRCFPRAGTRWRKPKADEIAECVELHLLSEIVDMDPEVIVPLGAVAAKYFTGYSQLYRARAQPIEWEHPWTEKTYQVRTTYHPAALLYDGGQRNLPKFMADLDQLKAHLTGEQRIPYHRYKLLTDLRKVNVVLNHIATQFEQGEIPFAVVDFETVGLDPYLPRGSLEDGCEGSALLTIQVTPAAGQGYSILLDHPESPHHRDEGALGAIVNMFNKFLRRMKQGIVGHNLQFDAQYGAGCVSLPVKVDWRAFCEAIYLDTKLTSWFLHSDMPAGIVPDHKLETLCGLLCQWYAHKEEAAGLDSGRMDLWPLDTLRKYGAADVDANYRLGLVLAEKLGLPPEGLIASGTTTDDYPRYAAHRMIQLDMIAPAVNMMINGAAISVPVLAEAQAEFEQELEEFPLLLDELGVPPRENGEGWNAGSTVQMAHLLFDVLGVANWYDQPLACYQKATKKYLAALCLEQGIIDRPPDPEKPFDWAKHMKEPLQRLDPELIDQKKVKWSSAKLVLENIELFVRDFLEQNPRTASRTYFEGLLRIIEALKKDRKRRTFLTRYIRPIPTYVRERQGLPVPTLVHTNFNIGCTGTGRWSSSKPSFHQFPYKSVVLKSFVSRWGAPGLLLDCDIKQIEMRIMAVLSKDPVMIETLRRGEDIHWAVTAQCENTTVEAMKAHPNGTALRRRYKQVSFGVIYGRGPKAIAEAEHMSEAAAKAIVSNFLEKMEGIGTFKRDQAEFVRAHGYVETPLGWRRQTPYIHSSNRSEVAKAERVSVNTPVQGGASQLVSQAIKWFYLACEALREQGRELKSKAWNYVHDSHSVDAYPGELWELMVLLRYCFFVLPSRKFSWLTVPLDFDFECGISWLESVEIGFLKQDDGSHDTASRKIWLEGKIGDIEKTLAAMMLWPEHQRPEVLSSEDTIVEEKPHREVIVYLPGPDFSPEELIG